MANVYFADTSALCKRYVIEPGTTWLSSVLDASHGNSVYIARVTAAELIAAITRRERSGTLAASDAGTARAEFRADFCSEFNVIEVTEAVVDLAMELAEKHGLRGYDAVQLAAALQVSTSYVQAGRPPIILLSSDSELNAAASVEALALEDPNTHP